MSILEPVASFFLYGEPPRSADAGFLHVEPLAIRSSLANWTIRSHAHRELAQLFCLEQGGAVMQADGKTLRFSAPSLVAVPSGTIHAFTWIPDSAGHVLTIGTPTLRPLLARAPDIARLFSQVASVPLIDTEAMRRLNSLLVRLAAENAWDAPSHGLATEALLTLVLVEAVRAFGTALDAPARDAALVAEFRGLIETSFRERPSLAAHLARLGVSERRLREACRRVTRRTPMQMVMDRTILEARRMLVTSNRSAAEIGYQLGFTDPAYFSRLFRAQVGENLRAFRKASEA